MIKLPLSEKELDEIIQILKRTNSKIYAKLWSYKINYLIKEKNNGLS
jgi:hypothetical protein